MDQAHKKIKTPVHRGDSCLFYAVLPRQGARLLPGLVQCSLTAEVVTFTTTPPGGCNLLFLANTGLGSLTHFWF